MSQVPTAVSSHKATYQSLLMLFRAIALYRLSDNGKFTHTYMKESRLLAISLRLRDMGVSTTPLEQTDPAKLIQYSSVQG